MVKRQFNKEEKSVALKSKGIIVEGIAHLEWLLEYQRLMLDKGYRMNYLEKVRVGRENMMHVKGELEIEEGKLKVLEDQLRFGVEIIEKKDDESDEDGEKKGVVGIG